MVTEFETAVIEMRADMKHVKTNTEEIKGAVFGNGKRGLKTRMTIVEVTVAGLVAVAASGLYCIIRAALQGS